MFKRILIANRGEIAVRVFRACRELDIEPVVVYSQADSEALHVQLAERAYCIGPARSADSYLNVDAILTVAQATGCDAIHPGRKLMVEAGVPVVPGSDGAVDTAQEAKALADAIGYPVLIKAAAGGGGRGMRRVFEPEQLIPLFEEARSESVACFGSGEMYLEKLILNPRHIEFQILADKEGHVIQLGDRDCSIQRRNQKLLEESPSKALTPELREKMGAAAVAAAKAAHYENAGTIEFVLDPEGNFYFIEMNTRIQVEHPVTELVTGMDLVREQIRIAAGLPLSCTQEEVVQKGHAIECRINAEDPANDFRPCPGKIDFVHLPGGFGVRVDTGLYTGYTLPPYYDSLMAKLIVFAPTRLEAIRRMRRALEELIIEGPANNTDLLHQIMHHPDFIRGNYNTGYLEANMDTLLAWSRSGEEDNKA